MANNTLRPCAECGQPCKAVRPPVLCHYHRQLEQARKVRFTGHVELRGGNQSEARIEMPLRQLYALRKRLAGGKPLFPDRRPREVRRLPAACHRYHDETYRRLG